MIMTTKLTTLRDKSEVLDPRLGRLVQFDERSRAYPIRKVLRAMKATKPRSYTWRCNQWLDQKATDGCVGGGCGHELIARPLEATGVTWNYCFKKIYWEAQKLDEWAGGEYPGAEPVYGGTSVLAGVKALKKAGWCKAYRWAFSIDDVILGVGYRGPCIVGTNWYEGMMEPRPDTGTVFIEGELLGGHCYLIRGYDARIGRFLCRNSWGRKWGVDGDFWILRESLARLLSEEGEAVFLEGRRQAI